MSSRCRSCGADITWTVTEAKKLTPVDPDGTPHWATCPQADEWRRKDPPSTSPGPEISTR